MFFFCLLLLGPGQTESPEGASVFTMDYENLLLIWSSSDLLANWCNLFHHLAIQRKSTRVFSIIIVSFVLVTTAALKYILGKLLSYETYLWSRLATYRKSFAQVGISKLMISCESVWPGLNKYAHKSNSAVVFPQSSKPKVMLFGLYLDNCWWPKPTFTDLFNIALYFTCTRRCKLCSGKVFGLEMIRLFS